MSEKRVRHRKGQPKEAPSRAERRLRAIQEMLSLIDPARRADVAKRAAQIPLQHRLGYVRSAAGLVPPRQAGKAHCLECMGWSRDEVRCCTSLACPWYPYRPYQERSSDPAGTNPPAEE
jgi:hypothetical protein